jgi:2,4-dienoyl-CoA reductase-like NADH-dependent reductase (Old Yellow Enzyme family)
MTASRSTALFSPFEIGSLSLDNRIFVAPMCQYSAPGGAPGSWHLQHYGALAVGGAAAMSIEATAVSAEGRITEGCLGLYDDEQEHGFTGLVQHLRRLSSIRVGIQLTHAGRKGSCHAPWDGGGGLAEGGWPLIAPSAIAFGAGRAVPKAMGESDIERVARAFVGSARRALRIGVDYLELHLAHGYLLSSFLSPLSNRRDDAYGGCLSRRMRFPLEVVSRVRAEWPAGRPLGVRINSHDWLDGGLSFDDTLHVCAALKEAGVDFICVSAGAVAEGVRIPAEPGYLLDYARRVRRATGLATRAVGLIHQPRLAERAIVGGHADCVAIGRAMLFDPRWALKAAMTLGVPAAFPRQYGLGSPRSWPGAAAALPGY